MNFKPLLPCMLTLALSAMTSSATGQTGSLSHSGMAHRQFHPFVVVIDAGHGGKDTGAIGASGTLEKDVVLAIAKRLANLMRNEPGLQPVLVRKGDQFVDLRQRATIARKAHADLFVSLHADAYQADDARGASVYTLSEDGASSEVANCLAHRENAAEIGGVRLDQHNLILASVLVDLSKNANQEASDRAAASVLNALQQDFPVHNAAVQKAGFAVLKSLDVPSLLIETAFISNPSEETKLGSSRHQEQLARAVLRGIRSYALETHPGLTEKYRLAQPEKTLK